MPAPDTTATPIPTPGDQTGPRPASANATDPRPQANPRSLTGWPSVLDHVQRNKIDTALCVTRLLTIIFTLMYLLNYTSSSNSHYLRALLATAATSAFRLQQRLPTPQMSIQFFTSLMAEDSAHYLFFSFIFFWGRPITLVLLPVALFALINSVVFIITILDKLGSLDHVKHSLSYFIEKYQQSILQTIAMCEVILAPIIVIGTLTGVLYFFAPLFYYRFLILRYNSRRNAYSRMLISQIKNTFGQYASRYMNRR